MYRRIFSAALMITAGVLAFSAWSHSQAADDKRLTNTDNRGVALQGYDPVAYFEGGKPQLGKAEQSARHEGAVYHFATAEHKALFEKNPGKYAPQFGGYCAFGVGLGKLFPVDVTTGMVVNGRLMLNKDPSVAKLFAKDLNANVAKADKEWPALVKTQGK